MSTIEKRRDGARKGVVPNSGVQHILPRHKLCLESFKPILIVIPSVSISKS